MATEPLPSNPIPGSGIQRQTRSLRRSTTRLPVTIRSPKECTVVEPTRPHATNRSLRHVPKSEASLSRTVTNSRLPSRNVLPSVVQAQPPSATPSVRSSSSEAQSLGRRSVRPPALNTKTPSLVSGSTISVPDSPRSALRRKPSTIDQYALRVKTDPESMQEHRNLIKTVYSVQHDDDPFPEAIFGMTLPSTSGQTSLKIANRIPNSGTSISYLRTDTKVSRPMVDIQAPFSDASSRNTDSPFSHQSTPTSASSHSSLAISALGSARHRDSLDLARAAAKTHLRKDKSHNASTTSSSRQEIKRPSVSGSREQIKDTQESIGQRPSFSNPFSAKVTPVQGKKDSALTKSTSRSKSHGALVDDIPPEFAHLNVDPPLDYSIGRLVPPRRPSRDGIDSLGLPFDIPVVQSNLSHIARISSRGSNEAGVESPPLSPKRTFGFTYRTSSRQSNKSQTHTISPRTPVERSDMDSPLSRNDSPMIVPSPNTLRSPRTGILSNVHTKSSTPPIASEKPKKGPAAGTGHEGYGKFGFRGRGSSIFGRTSRSSSKDSSTSHSGFSFLSRKKSMTDESEDNLDQFLQERREPIILRGNGRPGSNSDEREIANSAKSDHVDEVKHHTDSSVSERVTPTAGATKPALSELGGEGKEGHWLTSPTSRKSPTLMQRFKSKITSQSPDNASEHQQTHSPLHFDSIDQTTDLDLTDIEKLLSGDTHSSQTSKSSEGDSKTANPLVSYDRRHEGLLPSPMEISSTKRESLGSPVLLQAKTVTQVRAPQLVEISNTAGPSSRDDSKVRLRSVGRIPKVVRVGQNPRTQLSHQDSSNHNPDKSQAADSVADESREFIAFPSRKDSELSSTSSSGFGSPCITRSSFIGEDEVWNEYDNLLDEVLPPRVRASTTSSVGAPFQYGDMVDHKATIRKEETPKSISHPEASRRVSNLDTSRPSTTFSISDYLVDQDDAVLVAPTPPREARSPQIAPALPDRRSLRKPVSNQEARPIDNFVSAELRFAALMTSKWLSFGRLLFSPAHEEATTGDHTRILIVDGLGKEWSYNCALTYPKCQFYNLGPEPNSSSWETLSNHHHVKHPSISSPFPFPNNYFSAVVFRFPIAAADDAYQACFNEIKRTLRPSGYLEMSVLDLDLVNMGHIARKTIRDLKIRIHEQDSQREFENLRKCVVGIPVAGRIRRSYDSGSSSSGSQQKRTSEQPEPEYLRFTEWMQSSGNKNNEEDERHERRNDEDITKTVAKIGRWWYSSCYPDPGRSNTIELWDTPGLLRECERQRTSFRLLFCYAQKPVCVKRRTASV
ncbi:uncharacterized protein M437DRAFT_82255 [Aureobasidium melanogenum CBS 110374]|uniref:Methyltransferase type 11 domain-containing protein n=1 Tax=Aureobasidium melanogenum (strain CBS 110374) TaxID=1043003 RepID=A0A074W5V4_AURM1|nr:uncharacterized protein M437DRAFT_82255 [Aureobasidium melanogenum CBS 110374]KEQ65282.1 hypothetical protein M437DRAFT_82255 [Aureobasidium melanogenum CBS 110374]